MIIKVKSSVTHWSVLSGQMTYTSGGGTTLPIASSVTNLAEHQESCPRVERHLSAPAPMRSPDVRPGGKADTAAQQDPLEAAESGQLRQNGGAGALSPRSAAPGTPSK